MFKNKKVGMIKVKRVISNTNFEIYSENIEVNAFCKDLLELLNQRRLELMNCLEIKECRKVNIYITSNRKFFINYIACNFGVNLPNYCRGTSQNRSYIFSSRKCAERRISIYGATKECCS